ncbi:Purple acid phosphatases superfamily protein [Klebsormidium nitens]|uniref:Purple acid phosphatase n=1 Tax=Klebsormidium nitens TaxID=105231 RepID=A0A1Y1I5W5_KLENI|nr:Purple acid phosphatases superfamily protein [Klebsormidium nitens]|eukprot:GAQ84117.1 Purple acid phosphatases superfamily protein [Klebsormidium nitens]
MPVLLTCLLQFMLATALSQDDYVRPAAKPDINPRDWDSKNFWFGWRKWRKDADEPEQVHITHVKPGQVSVTWIVPSRTKTKSVVMYSTEPEKYSNEATGVSETYGYTISYKSGRIHHVTLGDKKRLLPDTTYYYRVGDPNSKISKELSFKTLPSQGPDVPLKFVVIGDLGQTEWSQSTLGHISKTEYDMVILAGDLSYADRYQPRWDTWGRLVEPVFSRAPFMSVEGNHEIETLAFNLPTPFTAYNARYPMPFRESGSDSNLYYSFEAAGAHVLMLGSYTEYHPGSPQYKWLEEDLSQVDRSKTPWLIAVFHAPWYNSNFAHQGEGDLMKAAMEGLLYSARVDIVFSGHVHAYERFDRVFEDKADKCGPVYIVVGDGGNREGLATKYLDPQPSISLRREASFGYGAFELANSTHAVWRWHRNQDEVTVTSDEVWLQSLARPGSPCGALVT